MKVAIIIDQIGGGGGEIFIKETQDRLLNRGDEVEILSGEEKLSTRKIQFSERGGVFRLMGILKASRGLRKELQRVDPDIALIFSPVAAIATMWAISDKSELKTIYAPRYLVLERWNLIEGGIKSKIKRIIEKIALSFDYDRIFALSKDMKDRMREAGAKSPIEIVPIGVDTTRFSSRDKKTRKPIFLFVGRFELVKGTEIFIEASKRLSQARFVMVGDEKKKLAEVPASVEVKGRIPYSNMADFYNEARAVILPSYSEGLPRACLEALACGTPVIASNVGGVSDLVIDGETGFLVEPGDVDQLVEKARKLLETPRLAEELGRKGRVHILKNYDEKKIMKKTIQELERVSKNLRS